MWNKGKENKEDHTPSLETNGTSPTVDVIRIADQLGPDTGDDVGDDGLIWKQRACKYVLDIKDSNVSPNGFTTADIVAKLNERVGLEDVTSATEFLMIEHRIFTTQKTTTASRQA
jgi:hypothetical protein